MWIATVIDETNITNASTDIVLVGSTDWAIGGGFEKATVLRVRGWLGGLVSSLNAVTGAIAAAIYVVDEDEAASDATSPVFYSDEDVVWTNGQAWGAGNAASVERPWAFSFDVDVKAMRRVSNGQELRLTMRAFNAGQTTLLSGVVRTLLRKS